MGDVYEKLAWEGFSQELIWELRWYFHYYTQTKTAKREFDRKNLLRLFYKFRETVMTKRQIKQVEKPKVEKKTIWLNLDIRQKEIRQYAKIWTSEEKNFFEGLLVAGGEKATISLTPSENGSYVCRMFLPNDDEGTETLCIRSDGQDMVKALVAVLFKYMVMLPEYEIFPEDDDELGMS